MKTRLTLCAVAVLLTLSAGVLLSAYQPARNVQDQTATTLARHACEGGPGLTLLETLADTLWPLARGVRPRVMVVDSGPSMAFAYPARELVALRSDLVQEGNPSMIAAALAHEFSHILQYRDGDQGDPDAEFVADEWAVRRLNELGMRSHGMSEIMAVSIAIAVDQGDAEPESNHPHTFERYIVASAIGEEGREPLGPDEHRAIAALCSER